MLCRGSAARDQLEAVPDPTSAMHFIRSQNIRNCFARSQLELRGPEQRSQIHPRRSRLGGSAPFCAVTPMATATRAGGRTEGGSRKGS
eukprot:3677938-Alexandrium_andersonii.AAC.1